MSDFNGNSDGDALSPDARSQSNLSATELEIQHNKAVSAIEYHKREIEAAQTSVANAEGKLARLKEQVAAQESILETTKSDLEEAEQRQVAAEVHLANLEGR